MSDGLGVRTIFIGGLPFDCTERELHLLFFEGGPCEAIKLERKGGPTCTAFVQFSSQDRATSAQACTNGMPYDPSNLGATLRVEFARQDFRKLPPAGIVHQHHHPAPPGGPHPMMRAGAAIAPVTGIKRTHWQAQQGGYSASTGSSTLFIGGFGANVSSAELQEYCASQDGFVRVSLKGEGSQRASAWAEYASPNHASQALSMLGQIPLQSLGRPPNLEFSKTDTTSGTDRPRMSAAPAPIRPSPAPFHQSGYGGGGGSSTLFIGGLEPQVQESEIHHLAMTQEGCVNVTSRNLGQPRATAWAQYETPELAAMACEALKEVPLPSMGRPANIEIARNDMKRKS